MTVKTSDLPVVQTYLGRLRDMPEYASVLAADAAFFEKMDADPFWADEMDPEAGRELRKMWEMFDSGEEQILFTHICLLRAHAYEAVFAIVAVTRLELWHS